MLILQQMTAFLIFIILGYYIRKKRILDEKGSSGIAWIVANVANPALIISGAVNAQESLSARQVLTILGLGTAVYGGLIMLSFLLPCLLKRKGAERQAYRNIFLFSNVGFMGFPLLSAMLGSYAVFYASIFTIPFNILLYTLCLWNFRQTRSGKGSKRTKKTGWKNFLNVGVLACVLALVLNFTRPQLPGFVKTVITNLANLTAALSMMNIGMFLVKIRKRELLTDGKLMLASLIKLLVIPVAGTALFALLIRDATLVTIAMVVLATPMASMVAILAEQYKHENRLETKAVALTTILSVVTIPAVSEILKLFGVM